LLSAILWIIKKIMYKLFILNFLHRDILKFSQWKKKIITEQAIKIIYRENRIFP